MDADAWMLLGVCFLILIALIVVLAGCAWLLRSVTGVSWPAALGIAIFVALAALIFGAIALVGAGPAVDAALKDY